MSETIEITSGQYITQLNLGLTNPTGFDGSGLGGTVSLLTFPNLTGIIATGNGITQLIRVSGAPLLQTIRFENNNLTKQSLEAAVTDIYNNRNSITGSVDKNINFCFTGASMGKTDRLIRLTGVNKYGAELDKLNFNVFYAVNGETDQTWTGAGTNNNFSNTGNWANGASPLDYDALYFGGGVRLGGFNDLPANTQFNGITFNSGAGAFNLSGAPFVLTFGGINNNSTVTQTVRNDIVLSGNNRTINCTRGGINLFGNIGGSGSLVKTGSATLSLSGNNTYTGNTFINSGTVNVLNSNPFGTGTVYCPNIATSSNGFINIPSTAAPANTIINNPIFINGSPNQSLINIFANKSATLNGLLACGPDNRQQFFNITNNATLTFNGGISGISGFNNNFVLQGVGTYVISTPVTFSVGNLTLNTNTANLILSSTGNIFNALRSMAGTVRTDVSFAINDERVSIGGDIVNSSVKQGVLNLNGTDQIIRNLANNSAGLSGNMLTNIFNNSSTGSNLILNQVGTSTYIGTISGNINLIKSGTATLTTSGNMTSGVGLMYTGFTTITGGILLVRTPFSDPLGKITSGTFSSGTSLTVGFALSPTSGESFQLLPGSTTNNYSIVTLQGAAAGRTATYNSSNSTLILTN
jgi:fibronectin-binding autotransporter adhesin